MSTSAKKLPLERASEIAKLLVADLEPACEQIQIAGSIRRKCVEVGDVEIVCVPRVEAETEEHLWDEATRYVRPLDDLMNRMARLGLIVPIKGGSKYRQFTLKNASELKVDLFITTAAQFGLILAIRTGPAEFSKRMVTPRKHGGLLPSNLKVKDGWIWAGDKRIDVPSEEILFADVLGVPWVPPEKR